MAPIAAAATAQAYQREAGRLATARPRVAGKVVTRDAGLSLGPFSIRFTAKDYEFDLTGAGGLTDSFADALDTAGVSQSLGDTTDATATTPNALTRRQALTSYRAVQDQPLEQPPVLFEATA